MAGYIGTQAVSVNTTSATITGDASIGGDLSLGDSDKAIFGAGSDLQIFHDGSNSHITDAGDGDLILRGSNNIRLQSNSGETYVIGELNGPVYLRHNDVNKLATKATGVTVTGEMAATTMDLSSNAVIDGTLSVGGTVDISGAIVHTGDTNTFISFNAADQIQLVTGGAERVAFYNDETHFNDGHVDMDFIVESDGLANAVFVDGGEDAVRFGKNTGDDTATGVNFEPTSSESYAFIHSVGDGWAMMINRQANDGVFINFRQANAFEGSIAVSGSTVSYNGFAGRHESSGIATNTAKGTVVSTINELDTYPADSGKAGQTRADHAKVKVSDSVGDARVYGVVDNFDENDKLFVVSVGIAPVKVTGSCSGGDLLESNGDGTAKVQSDDIVRSKTIGKVTIGNSNTGVKLVSCVMYCG